MNQLSRPERLKRILDSQGHSFQYAIVKEFMSRSSSHRWIFDACELPVVCSGQTIHIDAVFRQSIGDFDAHLVCECKRTDPAYGDWIFLKAPFLHRAYFEKRVYFDEVTIENPLPKCESKSALSHKTPVCHGNVEKVDWLWLVHNRSTELRHSQKQALSKDFDSAMESQHCRAIAIVSASGIASFLGLNFLDFCY